MRPKLRNRLTYSNIVSSLALFLALGGGAAYAANEWTSENIVDESLLGEDIQDGSLRKEDLGVAIRSARQPSANQCGRTSTYTDCIGVTLDLPRPQRLMLIASGEWESAVNNNAEGQCGFTVDDGVLRASRKYGEVATAPSSPFNMALNTVTGNIPAGSHRVALTCRTTAGTMRQVRNADLSVAAVGDG